MFPAASTARLGERKSVAQTPVVPSFPTEGKLGHPQFSVVTAKLGQPPEDEEALVRSVSQVYPRLCMHGWDAFISHAHEDKETVARPLTSMLQRRGLRVWLDENELVLGRGLGEQISRGLAESRFGVVILSRFFFQNKWTKVELEAMIVRATYREKWLIPVWHEIDHDYVFEHSPLLAGIYAVKTDIGLAKVTAQILRNVNPSPPTDLPTFRERRDLADQFVTALRARHWHGRAFETSIGVETMQQIRSMLMVADSDALLDLLKQTNVNPELRNRGASLLFGQRLRNEPSEFERVASEMRRYYAANVRTDAWQVLRAVAIAVADQSNDGQLILDWIDRIKTDEGLLQANLAKTDSYYNGLRLAIDTYVRRIQDLFHTRPAGRLWEVFYIGRRAVPGDADVIGLLTECQAHTDHEPLKKLCSESITLLLVNSSSAY